MILNNIPMTVLIVAFSLDCIIGDPRYPLHPVRLIGKAVAALKSLMFDMKLNGFFSGMIVTLVMILLVLNIYILLHTILDYLHPNAAMAFDIFLVYSSIALKDLVKHAMAVTDSLNSDTLDESRKHLSKMVGRDCTKLDEHGIARAAIESVAENSIDSFIAPLFWFSAATFLYEYTLLSPVVTGVMAILVYRTINTMDAMIGYKNDEYKRFGTFAARLDDILTFIPARLSLLVLTASSLICRLNTKEAIKMFFRDRKKHDSPNSAHAESFVAGALNLKLGGPTDYTHGTVSKPWLGDGSADADPDQVRTTCKLITLAGWITVIAFIIITA